MTELITLIELADNSYRLGENNPIGSYEPLDEIGTIDTNTGFPAFSHYSADDKTLVITFTGTNGDDTLYANVSLARGVHPTTSPNFNRPSTMPENRFRLLK